MQRKVILAAAVMAAGLVPAAGCGGTLEGKYRRGELTSTTTTRTTPTSGSAARGGAPGAPERAGADGKIDPSATRRAVAPPSGGAHR